jgi:long-chain acyl-CoA synthetase
LAGVRNAAHVLYRKEYSVEKIWLKSYAPGVPAEINADAYQSVVEVFEESCRKNQNRPAFYNLGTTLTYQQIYHYTECFAAYLQQELKLKKGSKLAIMLPNTLQYPIAMFGALRAGLMVVNVNPLYTADELAHQLNDSGTETLLCISNFALTVQNALPKMPGVKNVIVTNMGDLLAPLKGFIIDFVLKYVYRKIPRWHIPRAIPFKEVLEKGKSLSFTHVPLNNQDIAFLQYTGGTTGVSKGAMLTHRNIIANIEQADAWFRSVLVEKEEVIITALPLYHIFSLTANCLYFIRLGGLNVLITNPRDISGMIKEIGKFKFTAFTGVNTLFNALLKNPNFANLDFSELHLTIGGGMATQRVVADKWQEVTGVALVEAYGLTEAAPCVTINPANLKAFNGTIGLPVSSTDVCLFDDNGDEAGIGQPGELAVKGPQIMKGYWNNPSETAKVFTTDGWLLTGDIASIDENGFVKILERKKDMILVSGFNVYPNEIEDVIAKIKGVREVAVVAIPDESSGEAPKAFIVKDDSSLTEADVIKYCREHLTPYKIPKHVEFSSELPKSNVGKILRRALRNPAHA